MRLAYQVADEDTSDIIFCDPQTLKSKETVYSAINRLPEYDQYSEIGYVPPDTLLRDGWELSCYECEKTIEDEDSYIPQDEKIFCCHECYSISHERDESMKQTEKRVKNYLLGKYPELSDMLVGEDDKGIFALFKFPGSQRYAKWHSTIEGSIECLPQDYQVAINFFL